MSTQTLAGERSWILQSHRGAGVLSTDNTLEAFELGWRMGTIPEADVRTTSDGVLVAFHDATFDRVVNGAAKGPLAGKGVHDVTWAQLAEFDVGTWRGPGFAGHKVPRMETVFERMRGEPGRRLYIDVKAFSLESLSAAIDRAGVGEQVILASNDYATLRHWAELRGGKAQTLYWMGGDWTGDDEAALRGRFKEMRERGFRGITQVQVHAYLREPAKVAELGAGSVEAFTLPDAFFREVAAELRANGICFQSLPLNAKDHVNAYLRLLDLGVESFASDYPDVAIDALRTHQPRAAAALAIPPEPLSAKAALAEASETKALEIGAGILPRLPALFAAEFGDAPAIVVADINTFEAAGRQADALLRSAGVRCDPPFVFGAEVYAGIEDVGRLEAALRKTRAIPVVTGAGTLNDLTKLAAYRCGRPYLVAATAASVDGYTAFGASITENGRKRTFDCPAPKAVLADVAVIAAAPSFLSAAGYADLMAKVTAGADWLLADALGVDPVSETAWRIVQGGLRGALADPAGVARGEHAAIHRLVEGLMLGGFAMQRTRTSRPASGAEHQFSHLWDMQHHTHRGRAPSHGFKVGVATLAIAAFYEWLLEQSFDTLDIEACVAAWPGDPRPTPVPTPRWNDELEAVAQAELPEKWIPRDALRAQLKRLVHVWPELRIRLRGQLPSFVTLKERLRAVGAPCEPEQIGITRERLRVSFVQAQRIRRRFSVLDLAVRTRTLETGLNALFAPGGHWPL